MSEAEGRWDEGEVSEYLWDPAARPDAEVQRLERALAQFRQGEAALVVPPLARVRRARPAVGWRIAAAVVVGAGLAFGAREMARPSPWSVEMLGGTARAGSVAVQPGARVGVGQTVETGAFSTLRLAVGRDGLADLSSDSRLRVLSTTDNEQWLMLERGTLHVLVWARPRAVVVETPRARFVDLGCIYSLQVGADGTSRLGVRQGEVEVQSRAGGASLSPLVVTAGTQVELDSAGVLGVPYPVQATREWRARLEAVALNEPGSDSALALLLAEPRGAEVISLWHLAWRVSPRVRGQIYSALESLARGPLPTRHEVLGLEPAAMQQWRGVLRPAWTMEPSTWWGRMLLRMGVRKPVVSLRIG